MLNLPGIMETRILPEWMRKFGIPGRLAIAAGNGGLPKIDITNPASEAEIYLHGAHITGYRKTGEPPLLFMSTKSHFAPGEPVRGGVPLCFPWFGPRRGEPAHGLARILTWEPAERPVADSAGVTIRLRLPRQSLKAEWSALRTEFIVTIAETLAMELAATNESPDQDMEIENCLHTYFQISDIGAISIAGLAGLPFDDFAAGAAGARRCEPDSVLRITKETNRVYANHSGAVEIRDTQFGRMIRVEKSGSQSTVVWNPWTTQKLPDDFDPAEHRRMICVESGNVKQNRITLSPGETARLKVLISSHAA